MSRLPGLDLMRAVAIVWVMLFHAYVLGLGSPFPEFSLTGWMGVDLFFVLSGFLIASQWFEECKPGQPAPFGRFYMRRALRILPAYLVTVAIYFSVPMLREQRSIMPLWQFLTFTENIFVDSHTVKAFSHVWSLCVEEHFYMFFPMLAWLIFRRPGAWRTVGVLLAILLAGMAWRGHVWLDQLVGLLDDRSVGNINQRYAERIYLPTWTRLDGLLAGVTLAVIKTYRPPWWAVAMARANVLLVVGGVLLAGAVWMFRDSMATIPTILGYPLLSLAWAFIVASAASERSLLGRWRVPGAATIALLAYSLYLTHKLVYQGVNLVNDAWLEQHDVAAFFAYSAGSLLVASVMYLCVERPFLRLRKRLLGGHAPQPAAADLALEPRPANSP